MTPEAAIAAPDVPSTPESGTTNVEGSSHSSPGTGNAPSEQTAGGVTAPVQGQQPQAEADPFEGIPTLEQLQAEAEQGVPYAKCLAQLRSALDPLKSQVNELTEKYKPFEPFVERAPEELQQSVLQDHRIE